MLQKLKLLYWKFFFPKKLEGFKNPKCCPQCAYKFLSIKQNKGEGYEKRIVCSFDKTVHGLTHTCNQFKNIS